MQLLKQTHGSYKVELNDKEIILVAIPYILSLSLMFLTLLLVIEKLTRI